MSKFALAITEETIDLATFLNDGVTPQPTSNRPASLVFEINAPNEITAKVEETLEVFGEMPDEFLVIMK